MSQAMWTAYIFLIRFWIAVSATILDNQAQSEIDHVINTGIQCRNIPGLSVAIVKDGQVLLSKGYGVKDLDTQSPVTADTQFQIASTTKAFTAALLSNVVAGDSGKKISTNVYKVLPGRFKFNNTLRSTYTTMEDLLAHRTGIPRNNYARLATDYSTQNFAGKFRYLRHVGGFRDSFYYNDLMYGLAAHITTHLGQRPWKQQMQDTIFTPLGMSRSTFLDDVNFQSDDVATPYLRESGRTLKASLDFVRHWGKNDGSGNIVSTSNDMAKWMLMLLNDGKDGSGRRVLREGVVKEVFTAQNVYPGSSYSANYMRPVTPESMTTDRYSLGWKLGYYRGYNMIQHSGSTFGYRALLTLLPEMEVGVVTLMTGSDYQNKFRTALHMHLLDHALGHVPWINSSSVCTFPDPWRSSSSRRRRSVEDEVKTMEDDEEAQLEVRETRAGRVARAARFRLSRYPGTYRHEAYGNLEVRMNTSINALVVEYGVGLWRLQSTGGHSFDGLWLKAPPTLNKSFRFKTSGLRVYAIEGTGFASQKPPVFYRI
ncbi:hypothetical protein V1264_019216 [Littorina saxatilis]|uniref:Beta-lactamase-related domain-containing protein n=2 Tax=Littorina saxatilis TaxID=31220 RepID=A0AAN9BGT6_9CAEN